MNLSLWVHNLVAYSLQIALVIIIGSVLPLVFRLRMPPVLLMYRQILLAACIMLPLLQPWKQIPAAPFAQSVVQTTEITIPADGSLAEGPRLRLPDSLKLYQAILFVLGAGVLMRVLWLAAALQKLSRYRQGASVLLPLPPAVSEMQSLVGIQARICVSDRISGPVTFGFLDPLILLPAQFLKLHPSFQKGIACHELLHVRRRDWFFTVVEESVGALFWFHPAISWLLKRIQLNREQTVDRQVLEITGTQRTYIQSLVHMASAGGQAQALPAPLFLMEHQLTQRVALILKEVSMSKRRLAVSLVTISILLFITGLTASRYLPLTTEAAGNSIAGERFIGGDVYDQAGAVIPGAAVKLIDKNTGQVLESAISDSSGHFEVRRPDQGELVLRIEYRGFKPALYDQTSAPQGNIRVTLALGQIQETVKVRSDVVDTRTVTAVSAAPRTSPAGTKPAYSSKEREKQAIRVNEATQAGKALQKVQPVYPKAAKQAGVTGTVVLEVTINEAGDVSNVTVLSGNPLLQEAAVEAAKQWKFSPSYLNGDPISVVANLSFNFAMAEDKVGLSLTMDDAGNLLEGEQRLEGERLNARITESEGSIRIRPNPRVPLKVVEETLQVLRRLAGDRPLRLSAPYAFRDGRLTKSEPIRVGGNVQASKLLNRVSPIYPKEAKEAGVEGAVVLQITVNEAGEVSDIQVVSGHELLRDSSVEAVRQWRYSPTLLNGEPVPVVATVTVQFALK